MIDLHIKNLSLAVIREKLKAGDYAGCDPNHAKGLVKMAERAR